MISLEDEMQPGSSTYNRGKKFVNLTIRNAKPQKSSKTFSETEETQQKLKETLMTMTDVDKPVISSKRQIILVIHICVWLITFIAVTVAFASSQPPLRYV